MSVPGSPSVLDDDNEECLDFDTFVAATTDTKRAAAQKSPASSSSTSLLLLSSLPSDAAQSTVTTASRSMGSSRKNSAAERNQRSRMRQRTTTAHSDCCVGSRDSPIGTNGFSTSRKQQQQKRCWQQEREGFTYSQETTSSTISSFASSAVHRRGHAAAATASPSTTSKQSLVDLAATSTSLDGGRGSVNRNGSGSAVRRSPASFATNSSDGNSKNNTTNNSNSTSGSALRSSCVGSISFANQTSTSGKPPLVRMQQARTKKQRLQIRLAQQQQQRAESQDSTLSFQSSSSSRPATQQQLKIGNRLVTSRAPTIKRSNTSNSSNNKKRNRNSSGNTDAWVDSMLSSQKDYNEEDEIPSIPTEYKHTSLFVLDAKSSSPSYATSNNIQDVHSLQDAGNHQLLHDECEFLCSSILSSTNNGGGNGGGFPEAAMDLVQLLSHGRNRKILFLHGNSNHYHNEQQHDENNNSWQRLLQVFAFAKTCVQHTLCNSNNNEPTSAASVPSMGGGTRTKSARRRLEAASTPDQEDSSAAASTTTRINSDKYAKLLECIILCLNYVSLDCTTAVPADAKAARRMRQLLLTNSDAMQGVLYLILADGLIERLRGNKRTSVRDTATSIAPASAALASPVPVVQFAGAAGYASSPLLSTPTRSPGCSSANTPDSVTSRSSLDPTRAGRRRKKRRLDKKVDNDEDGDNDNVRLSFASEETRPAKKAAEASAPSSTDSHRAQHLLFERLQRAVLHGASVQAEHGCDLSDVTETVYLGSTLPLLALSRIASGKMEGQDTSCLDDVVDGEDGDDDENPLMVTNQWLCDAGVIPLLAQALAETLSAVTCQVHQPQFCDGCLSALQTRVSLLVSLVDGASLLSESNRQVFCEEGYMAETNGYLILGLVSVLRQMGDKGRLFQGDVWDEIALDTLRMLTSLSHENQVAAMELEAPLTATPGGDDTKGQWCLYVLARVLHQAVRHRNPDGFYDKLVYDAIIYCLNIFANVVESGGSCQTFVNMRLPDGLHGTSTCFLTWLTRWLVGQTKTFQDAVVESTFGTSPSKHTERKLSGNEEEKLNTVGNGFVFLTCLLVNESERAAECSCSADRIVLRELPGADREAKLAFLKNSLKAFLNFYHFSVGALSVAIIAPVKGLMKRLEVREERRREIITIE
jgi:hypothetical protein